jgi:predicted small metal-binding protein
MKPRPGYMNLNLMNNQVKVMQHLGTDCSTTAHVVPLCARMTITTTARALVLAPTIIHVRMTHRPVVMEEDRKSALGTC